MSTAGGPQHQQVGSAADEAGRLVEALQGWWRERAQEPVPGSEPETEAQPQPEPEPQPRAAPDPQPAPGAGPTAHDPSSPCRYCPWCRVVSTAQTVRPEVMQHLLATAESVVGLLRELSRDMTAAERPAPGAPPGAGVRTVTIPVEPEDDAEHEPADEPGGH